MARGKGKAKAHAKVEVPPHLRLGLNWDAYRKFVNEELSKVGFHPQTTAIRNHYPESLFWIAEQYGDRPTGYDVCEATKMWLRMNNAEDKSVCEVLKERGWKGIGEVEVFLSHVQAESPRETLWAMNRIDGRFGPARNGTKHNGSKIWVDYFCLRQNKNDFKTQEVEQLWADKRAKEAQIAQLELELGLSLATRINQAYYFLLLNQNKNYGT